jgi:tight adherence protein B
MNQQIMMLVAAASAFSAIVAIGFIATGNGSSPGGGKRVKAIAAGQSPGRGPDVHTAKRKQMADAIQKLREREEAVRKNRKVSKSIPDRLEQAGLHFPVLYFWLGSAGLGAGAGAAMYISGLGASVGDGAIPGMQILIPALVAFVAALGVPRWALGMAIGMRQKKFVGQFADAIDVIVRGVKSGLPLNECLKVIARESSQPLAGEFEKVCDSLQMGVSLESTMSRLYQRMPLQEVNFFAIVLNIQAKAGGNLSEALGNLSAVLRARKLLKEKVKALSSEAKASAWIIGSLPVIVMVLVYFTTPAYIMTLFTDPTGNLILLGAACLMATGVYIMRQMINFDV